MGGLRGYLCFLRTFYTLGDGVVTFNFYATANVKGFDVYSLYPRQNGARIVSHLPGDLDWLRSLDLAMCGLKPSLNRLQAPGKFDDSILNWRKACAEKYGFAYRQLLFPREPLSWIWNIRPLPYVEPAEDFVLMPYFVNLGSMTHGQRLYTPELPIEDYVHDGCYNLARAYGADDSRLVGWHVGDELGQPTIHSLMAVARTPSVVAAWKNAHPDGGDVPDARDFLGWNPKTDLNLRDGWEIRTAEGKWEPMKTTEAYRGQLRPSAFTRIRAPNWLSFCRLADSAMRTATSARRSAHVRLSLCRAAR